MLPCDPSTPLSEPELSTDDSATSEEGESERGSSTDRDAPASRRVSSKDALCAVLNDPHQDPWGRYVPRHSEGSSRGSATPRGGATPGYNTPGAMTPVAATPRSRWSAMPRPTTSVGSSEHGLPAQPERDTRQGAAPQDSGDAETQSQPSAEAPPPRAAEPPAAPPAEGQTTDTPEVRAALATTDMAAEHDAPPADPSAVPAENAAPAENQADEHGDVRVAPTRTRSSSGNLHRMRRGGRGHRSHERLGSRGAQRGGLHRLGNALHQLAMTQAKPVEPAKPAKKKTPIVFTTGDDGNASDEEEHDGKAGSAPPQSHAETKWVVGGEEDDDGWASDEAAEEEERRRAAEQQAHAEQQRREQEEQERRDMFKKRSLRSASLADLSAYANTHGEHGTWVSAAPGGGPGRGLLSTMFHPPEQQHQHPMQARNVSDDPRRRRASERHRATPGRTLSFAPLPSRGYLPGTARYTSTPSVVSGKSQKLETDHSKSAIALPMLNMMSLRSSTAAQEKSASGSQVTSPSVSPRGTAELPTELPAAPAPAVRAASLARIRPARTKSTPALERLAALAGMNTDEAPRRMQRPHGSMVALGASPTSTARISPGHQNPAPSNAGPSLSVQHEPVRAEDYFRLAHVAQQPQDAARSRPMLRTARTTTSTGTSPQAAEQTTDPDGRHPDAQGTSLPVAVQSPRTTRQNMLQDELSESLRQNLLWDHQTNARVFGMAQQRSDDGRQSQALPAHTEAEESSFHHKGW